MELLQLHYFCDAAETQNFSKTANKFLVPASNISQSIKRLERELKTPLFDRSANKVRLNNDGLLFYQHARAALDLLAQAQTKLPNRMPDNIIKINIHINRRVVMDMIERFRRQHPEVRFITTHAAVEDANEFDIIVTDRKLDLPHSKVQAAEEELLLAYHRSAFRFEGSITAQALQNAPFITMSSGNSMYENTKKICNEMGFEPNIVLQSEDPFYIRKCIELGLGISIVPELSWRGQFSEQVMLKKLGEYKRTTFVYKKHGIHAAVDEFYDLLLQNFRA